MRALGLWQPWAALVAHGAKRVETRHWPAPALLVGQRLAIYATKTPDHLGFCMDPFCAAALAEIERDGGALLDPTSGRPWLGYLLGHVRVARCSQQTEQSIDRLVEINPREHAFGLYEPGRFAWVLEDPRPLARPLPLGPVNPETGKGWNPQGIFTVPDEWFDGTGGPPQGALW